jgi:hypothetical protein
MLDVTTGRQVRLYQCDRCAERIREDWAVREPPLRIQDFIVRFANRGRQQLRLRLAVGSVLPTDRHNAVG